MWRRLWRCGVLKQTLSSAAAPPVRERRSLQLRPPVHSYSVGAGGGTRPLLLHYSASFFSCDASGGGGGGGGGGEASSEGKAKGSEKDAGGEHITCEEAKRLMRLVNVESLKTKLGTESKELIPYDQLLETCQAIGVARSPSEAAAFARILDDAGVVLLFRDKVYLHPHKVVDLIRKAVPLALTPEDDPLRDELNMLHKKKEEIDVLAHKQVRRILWCGLGFSIVQISLFFRLTFWEFSWDVMEPIAFFAASTGIVVSYAYFMYTSRDPTYQDFMKRLFLSRQKKLFKKLNFDIERYKELQQKRSIPLHATTSSIKQVRVDMELDDD